MLSPQRIPADGNFPHAHCESCDVDVLLYRNMDEHLNFTFHCLDCDLLIDTDGNDPWTPQEVVDAGYPVEGIIGDGPVTGSCSDGGCSGGSCSSS